MTALAARKAFTGPRGKFLENLTHVTASTFLSFPLPFSLPPFPPVNSSHELTSSVALFRVLVCHSRALPLPLPPSLHRCLPPTSFGPDRQAREGRVWEVCGREGWRGGGEGFL